MRLVFLVIMLPEGKRTAINFVQFSNRAIANIVPQFQGCIHQQGRHLEDIRFQKQTANGGRKNSYLLLIKVDRKILY